MYRGGISVYDLTPCCTEVAKRYGCHVPTLSMSLSFQGRARYAVLESCSQAPQIWKPTRAAEPRCPALRAI